jgi:hypothetical protein
MADWRIYPNSGISKLPGPLARLALGLRNIKNLFATEQRPRTAQLQDLEALEIGVEYVMGARVIGSIAEFGAHGFTASAIADAMMRLGPIYDEYKSLHLFDSFEGFPEPSAEPDRNSPHVKDKIWDTGVCLSPLSADALAKEMQRWLPAGRIHMYNGWFSDTLPTIQPGTCFAMVHFDCVLYASTFEALDYLFAHKLLSPGALLMFHTWNCNQASPEHGDRRAWAEAAEKYSVQYDNAGTYSWHGQSFHVQSYSEAAP